jgi:hypothetical protein
MLMGMKTASKLALAVVVSMPLACVAAPGEGEPCRSESTFDYGGSAVVTCGSGLECDRVVCLPPDGPEAPRRFGDFVALYDPRASSPTRIFETEGNGAPWLVLDPSRLAIGGDFIWEVQPAPGSSRVVGERLRENQTDSLASTGTELWALGVLGSTRGYSLPDVTPLGTGLYLGPDGGRMIAGNEAGELAWLGAGEVVLTRDRGAVRETVALPGTTQGLVVEPGWAVVALQDGQLVSPTGRGLAPHEALSGLHRPLGGPTLAWIDPNDATTPTRVVAIDEDGRLVPIVELPIELSSLTGIDAHEGHLYLSCEWGLFVSAEPLLGLQSPSP